MEQFPAKRGHLFHDHNEGRELLVKDDKKEEECFVLNFFALLAFSLYFLDGSVASRLCQHYINFVSTLSQKYVKIISFFLSTLCHYYLLD